MTADSKLKQNLTHSISSFIFGHELDGVELNSRWPETKEQKENYMFLVRETRNELEKLENPQEERTIILSVSSYLLIHWHKEMKHS